MGKKWGRTAVIFDESMDDIARDFEGGAELREIAVKYDVSPPTITNWLISAGYKHRQKGRYPRAMKEKAVELAARGWDPIAIANLFKTKLGYVHEWLGLPTAPTRRGPRVGAPMEPAYKRHVVGRRWTDAQKEEVLRLISAGIFSVDQIYRITNASRVRQQGIWGEFVGSPFPIHKPRRVRPDTITSAEAFQHGRLEALREARALAESSQAQGQVTALVPLEQALEGQSEEEIEEDFRRFEEQKRFLDEGA